MFKVTRWPGISKRSLPKLETYLKPAVARGGDLVEAQAVDRSPGGIAEEWLVTPISEGITAVGVLNTHPGALPLDRGATWPGAMPPWGEGEPLADWAESRGLAPFLVARGLQRKGLKARHFALASLKAVRAQVTQTVRTEGVQRWTKELTRE